MYVALHSASHTVLSFVINHNVVFLTVVNISQSLTTASSVILLQIYC